MLRTLLLLLLLQRLNPSLRSHPLNLKQPLLSRLRKHLPRLRKKHLYLSRKHLLSRNPRHRSLSNPLLPLSRSLQLLLRQSLP